MNNSQKKVKADGLKAQALEAAETGGFLNASFYAGSGLKALRRSW